MGSSRCEGFKAEPAGPRRGARSRNSPGFGLVCTVYVKTGGSQSSPPAETDPYTRMVPSGKEPGGEEGEETFGHSFPFPSDLTGRSRRFVLERGPIWEWESTLHRCPSPTARLPLTSANRSFLGVLGAPSASLGGTGTVSDLPCRGSWVLPSADACPEPEGIRALPLHRPAHCLPHCHPHCPPCLGCPLPPSRLSPPPPTVSPRLSVPSYTVSFSVSHLICLRIPSLPLSDSLPPRLSEPLSFLPTLGPHPCLPAKGHLVLSLWGTDCHPCRRGRAWPRASRTEALRMGGPRRGPGALLARPVPVAHGRPPPHSSQARTKCGALLGDRGPGEEQAPCSEHCAPQPQSLVVNLH